MTELKTLTLTNLGDGIIENLFQHELKKVLDNITDRQTEHTKKRRITIAIDITPDVDRKYGNVAISVSTKLTGPRVADTFFNVGGSATDLRAIWSNKSQGVIDLDDVVDEDEGVAPDKHILKYEEDGELKPVAEALAFKLPTKKKARARTSTSSAW